MEQIVLQTISACRLDEDDWEQSAWIYEEEIRLSSLTAFYGEITSSVDEESCDTLVFVALTKLLTALLL